MPRRQLVLMCEGEDGEGPSALGSVDSVIEELGVFNTAPDGSSRPSSVGTKVLYGPGFVVEVASGQKVVHQAILTVEDDELAWPVLARLCQATGWRMMDIETGQVFGGGG